MDFSWIRETRETYIRTITLSGKSDLNPLNIEMLEEIRSCLSQDVQITIIRGSKRAFSAGADIRNFQGLTPEKAYSFSRKGHAVMNYIAGYGAPVIAAIDGFALGGGFELALACDIRIASKGARLGLTELNIGVIPGWGGTQRMISITGEQIASYLIWSSRVMEAEEAKRYGFLFEVVEDAYASSVELARQLAEKDPSTLAFVKNLVRKKSDEKYLDEMDLFAKSFTLESSKEGVEAFLNKRKPVFRK